MERKKKSGRDDGQYISTGGQVGTLNHSSSRILDTGILIHLRLRTKPYGVKEQSSFENEKWRFRLKRWRGEYRVKCRASSTKGAKLLWKSKWRAHLETHPVIRVWEVGRRMVNTKGNLELAVSSLGRPTLSEGWICTSSPTESDSGGEIATRNGRNWWGFMCRDRERPMAFGYAWL